MTLFIIITYAILTALLEIFESKIGTYMLIILSIMFILFTAFKLLDCVS